MQNMADCSYINYATSRIIKYDYQKNDGTKNTYRHTKIFKIIPLINGIPWGLYYLVVSFRLEPDQNLVSRN